MRTRALAALLLVSLPAYADFEVNGVGLGASESEVRKAFPSAHCRPLEWTSLAADRRCDDSRATFEGLRSRVTFYLRKDAVQAFDVRFDPRDLERFLRVVKKHYGEPDSAGPHNVERDGRVVRELYRARWQRGADRASLNAEIGKRRASLLVSRGDFEEEIYRVR